MSTIRHFLPDSDSEAENCEVERREIEDTEGIVLLPGAAELLRSLPKDRWTIATSCTRVLAQVRLRAAGLPIPERMVTSTEVSHGKPHPEPFMKAAAKLGFPASECIVVEDVAAGVRAGKGAGARVIALRTTIRDSELREAGADVILNNCADISVVQSSDFLQLRLNGSNKHIDNPVSPLNLASNEREPEMHRRDLLKSAALLPALGCLDLRAQLADDQSVSFPYAPTERLNQGPFGIEQDEGWQTILFTTPSEKPLRNPGFGLVGYTWEESGPSLAARAGRETLEQHVEKMSSLPFVDVLYIRCDWRNVQSSAGRLDLPPVFALTFDAAKRKALRVAFRVQLSNTSFQPEEVALPAFLRTRIPLVNIARIPGKGDAQYREPRYDHPEFQKAFAELVDLLAAEFDGNPLLEWVDLMQYGFWGEGHTSNYPSPFPDYPTAEKTSLSMTARQITAWKKTPLAVNTQPDISNVGNRAVIDMATRAGAWLRSDSIIVEEPIQIDELVNRPPWSAAILEDGYFRQYDIQKLSTDATGINVLENYMLHVQDLRANYWALWTESENLARYDEKYPRGFERLRTNLGYRLRPSWVWQRKRYDTFEVIICVSNRGVAGVPGVLWLHLDSPDGGIKLRGTLDPGHPHAGGLRQSSFLLPKGYAGKLNLSARLEIRPGVQKSIAWCCEQPTNPDGSITIELRDSNDRGWRKGV